MIRDIGGRVAAIRWGYFLAAAVDGYTATQCPGGWTITGALVPGQTDHVRLGLHPLMFVAPYKGGAWRWPIIKLTIEAGRFTAECGPLEGSI